MNGPDPLPLGVAFAVGEILLAALRAGPELADVTIHEFPVRPATLADGSRVVWFEDVSDGPLEQSNQINREYRFTVGVINRTKDARRGVHTDYRAVKRIVNAALPGLKDTVTAKHLREGDIAFGLENVDVGGGVIISSWTLGYRDPGFRT